MIIEYLQKIGLSLLLGALIGSEREYNDKPCGLRTIMLVCLGATLFTIVGLSFDKPNLDSLRLLYASIIGIGFLGGGVIMQKGKSVEGITTASTLWAMVGVGLCCGIGQYQIAIVSTLAIFLVLMLKYVKVQIKGIRKRRKKRNSNET